MRNPLFAIKTLCASPSVWAGAILSTLFVVPCNSQVVTTSNDETWRNSYQTTSDDNENAEKLNTPYKTYTQTTEDPTINVDPIEDIRQMIDASLPMVKILSEQKKIIIKKEDIEDLMSVMYFKVNGKPFGYRESSESMKVKFSRFDFKQLFDILIFVDKSLSEMQNQQMVNSEIRYAVSMEKISKDLLSCNFFAKVYPTMIVYAIKNYSFDDAIISVYGEIDLLNNNRFKDFQPKSIEELEGITSQAFLADIAKNNENTEIRLAAIQRLDDQTALANIANNDSDFQIQFAAVQRLTNQTSLANVAYNNSSVQVRLAAVRKLTNQTSLANVAYNDRDTEVRFAAVQRLTNQTSLANVAYNDRDAQVRFEALQKLTNQTSLANVAYNDRDPDIRLAALQRLTNQTSLANIAYNDRDAQVRLIAVQKLDNQTSLTNVANNDRDTQVRLAAVQKLTNRTTLTNIANNDRDEQVRKAASQRLNSL